MVKMIAITKIWKIHQEIKSQPFRLLAYKIRFFQQNEELFTKSIFHSFYSVG